MKNFKKNILIIFSIMLCFCVAMGGLNLDLGKSVNAQNGSVEILTGGIDSTQNLFETATISDTNYIINQWNGNGDSLVTVGDYIATKANGSHVTVGGISQMPITTTDTSKALSYSGARLTMDGTTTLDMGVVDLTDSRAEDVNPVIGFVPSLNFLGPKTADEVTNPYLGIYYTFRSTVNPEKYFSIAMKESVTYKYASLGIGYNGTWTHYGQGFPNVAGASYWNIDDSDRTGYSSFRFDGSMITTTSGQCSTATNRVWIADNVAADGGEAEYNYNYPVKIYYDYETSCFYQQAIRYDRRNEFGDKGVRVTADDGSHRYLLFNAAQGNMGKGYSTANKNSNGWEGFTEEEAKSVAVSVHVDWNPAYTGSHDILITDFAGEKVSTANADDLKANKGTAGLMKEFTSKNGIASLADGYKVNLSDNDIFTKLVSFEVYPEQVGKAKATNNSGLFEVGFTLSDGTNNLKINLKDFNEGDNYRNCYTVSVNGEERWAQNQEMTFTTGDYGFPSPYGFDKYVRYPATILLDQYGVDDDAGVDETVQWYSSDVIRTDTNYTPMASYSIYYNAADNCLYVDAGSWVAARYTNHEREDGVVVKRWKIADLGSTYGGQRTAFAGFGDKDLSFSMATTLVNGFDSVKIRVLEVDGQKLGTDQNGKTFAKFDTELSEFESGIVGKTYTFATPVAVSSLGNYTLTLTTPSGGTVDVENDKFIPEEIGEYLVTYDVNGQKFISSLSIYQSIINENSIVGNFTKVGDYIDYIKDISYGEFTADNFSGGGLMVTTRNKLPEYVNVTDTDNATNPWLIDYDSRIPLGVELNNAINLADNTEETTLVELAFPAPDGTKNYKFHQNKAYKVIIADAENSDRYIAVYFWNAWYSGGDGSTSKMSMRVGAIASWETQSGEHSGLIGYDDGTTFTLVDKEQGDGVLLEDVTFAGDSNDTVRVSFDYETGKLYANGELIRSFKDVSANGTKFFEGFTDGKAKLSVSVQRSNKYSTDEWTRFCIMTIDGVSLLAKNGEIYDNGLGLKPYMVIEDLATGTSFVYDENTTVNVGSIFSSETTRAVGYLEEGELKNINDLNNVVLNENKTYELAYLDFYTEAGASIRISGYTGLRFRGFIDSQIDASIQDNIKEYGMILAPTDYIENKAFTLDDYQEGSMYKQPAQYTVEGAELTHFYVTMTHLKAANMAREFSARVYVEISYDDGSTGFVYSNYTETDNSRSAYEVAKSAYSDEDEYAGMDETTVSSIKTFLQNNYLNKAIDVNTLGVKANGDTTYTVDSVSTTETTISLVVSGASGVRCLVYDGAAYLANGSTLIMEDSGDKLNVTFTLPTRTTDVQEQAVTIIENGATEYSILVPTNATQSELFAAQELQTIMLNSYGAEMPIVSSYDGTTTKYISLGNTELRKKANLTLSAYTENQGGFGIKSYGEGVAIYAEDDYALFYGMYRFLEENFGYKYYAYDCTVIDTGATQTLKNFDYEDYPDIKYRSLYSELTRVGYRTGQDADNLPEELKAAYINMHLYNTGSAYQIVDGNGYSSGNYGTSVPPFAYGLDDQSLLTYFLPYDDSWNYYGSETTYGESHPEWYNKTDDGIQICLTKAYNNDNGMYNIIRDKLTWLIKNRPNKTFFEIGIGDNRAICQCSDCQSAYNTYGESGVYLRLVNKLANDVKVWQANNCPRREIYLMAYAYLEFIEPPKGGVVAADNVIVRIAPIELDYSKAITASNNYYDDSWLNRITWTTIFEGWSKAAVNLAIWDYRADFRHYLQPLPLQKSTEANIEYYKALGVKEIYSQGIAGREKIDIYPFAEMDDWIRCRMYWDTTLSYNDLRTEFLNAYYGAAAPYVLQYIQNIESAFGSTEFELGEDLTVSQLKSRYSSSWVSQTKTIFDNAYSAVSGNAEITRRLDYLSMFYRYLQIKCSYTGADKATFKTMCSNLGIWKVEINLTVEDFTA